MYVSGWRRVEPKNWINTSDPNCGGRTWFSRNARSRMMPTRRETANLPGSGRDSWPLRYATPVAFSVLTVSCLSERSSRGDGRMKKPRDWQRETIFQTLHVLATANSDDTAVIYVSISFVRDLCTARSRYYCLQVRLRNKERTMMIKRARSKSKHINLAYFREARCYRVRAAKSACEVSRRRSFPISPDGVTCHGKRAVPMKDRLEARPIQSINPRMNSFLFVDCLHVRGHSFINETDDTRDWNRAMHTIGRFSGAV